MGIRLGRMALAALTSLSLAGLTASAAQAGAPAASRTAAATVQVQVVGIDTNGKQTSVLASIYSVSAGTVVITDGQAVHVATGKYWVGASVPTQVNGIVISQTLVMRLVSISSSETIALRARGRTLVGLHLTVPATQNPEYVEACIGGTFVSGAAAPAGALYAVPVQAKDFRFSYATTWQGTTASYELAGVSEGGIPDTVNHQADPATMARVRFQLRASEVPGGFGDLTMTPASNCIIPPLSAADSLPAPGTLTEYVSPGRWTPEMVTTRAAFWRSTLDFAAGRSYTDTFGGAVWGPGNEFPYVNGHDIYYSPISAFVDPAQASGGECCDTSDITLSLGGRVIKHVVMTSQGFGQFSARMPSAGWYTLAIRARRTAPGLTIPASMLSRSEAVRWHFHAAPDAAGATPPVTITRYVARGLNADNQAPAAGTTKLALRVVAAPNSGFRLKTLTVQASSDGGKTWHAVTVVRQGGHWLATVHDPSAGYVALRSTVTDTAGNSTVQTIYQAYAIG